MADIVFYILSLCSIVLCGDSIEFFVIKLLVMGPHPPDGMEQLAHDGTESLPWLFTDSDTLVLKGLDMAVRTHGDQRGHIQSRSQMFIASFGDRPGCVQRSAD